MNKKALIGMIAFIVVYFIVQIVSGFYVDWEWFRINGHLNVFWTLLLTKFNVHGIFSAAFIALFFLNFLLIRLMAGSGRIFTSAILNRLQLPFLGTPRRALFIVIAAGVVVTGFFLGLAASVYWREFLIYLNAVPFEGFPKDPIFSLDMGFYVFRLPFYQFLYGWLMFCLAIITVFSLVFHLANGGIGYREGAFNFSLFARAHLSTLAALIVILYGVGYRLSAYQLLFADKGRFFGAGYTEANAQLLAYNVCMVISFVAAGLLLFNIVKRSFKLPVLVLLTLIPVNFVLGTVYPGLMQRFVVVPNELDKETKYIEHNIAFTRRAYGLEGMAERPFANKPTLTPADIARNRSTLESIRLWDWRPLKQTYKQLQELRPYYQFNDVDVDRYSINNTLLAVNLAARELAVANIAKSSQTWVNKHLVYTHGYGIVFNRVDRVTADGQPEMLIYDIPPKTKIPLEVKRPEIYYGEHDNPYVITNTTIQPGEFDYPYGDQNRYTRYAGAGGSALSSFAKRLLFAISFRDINLLISSNVTAESRVLFRRNIGEMVRTLTPFLEFETDPYVVLSEGRLFWIIDAYTTSNRFPYATPVRTDSGRINYIRNSVKVVIDAYNGSMSYYLSDPADPIVRTYANIFPGLFKKLDEMPAGLRAHIRYPEAIFNIQCRILLRYHMTRADIFYNNDDAWDIPRQIYDDSEEPVHSYYIVTTLPGEKKSEFILVMPFTPVKKDNMIGFLIARCDVPNYGALTLYMLPKDKLSYGPMMIERRIKQDADISKQLALWSGKGSRVIRGNMLFVPIEESLIFVEPLYLKAESNESREMPELKRVIVSFADRITMGENLNSAMEQLFTGGGFSIDEGASSGTARERLRDLADKAQFHLNEAERYQREGDWARYGEELKKMKAVLNNMKGVRE